MAAVIGSDHSASSALLFVQKREVRFVTSGFHVFFRNEMQSSRVNRVTLSTGRFRVSKEMTEVGVTAFGANLSALHIVLCVRPFDKKIFRDRFTKCGHADLTVEFVERSKEW